eukprot:g5357.t1
MPGMLIRYGLAAGQPQGEQLVRPIKGWPSVHPKVTTGACHKFAAGDPFPTGTNTCGGDKCKTSGVSGANQDCAAFVKEECINPPFVNCGLGQYRGFVNAGFNFFNYASSSSNTGLEKARSVRDQVWLVGLFSKPGAAHGSITYQIQGTTSAGAPMTGVNIAFHDDASSAGASSSSAPLYYATTALSAGESHYTQCVNVEALIPATKAVHPPGRDCGAWNENTGSGSFHHVWDQCCNDGIVLGPFPSIAQGGFQLDFKMPQQTSGTTFELGAWDEATSTMNFVSISEAQFRESKLEAYSCNQYCSTLTSCGECIHGSDEQCGWCASDNTCVSRDAPAPQCAAGGTPTRLDGGVLSPAGATCSCDCASQTSNGCGVCSSFPGCVWCDGACVDGVGDGVDHWVCGGKNACAVAFSSPDPTTCPASGTCAAGLGLAAGGVCAPCAAGTYSDADDNQPCKSHSTCPVG